MKVYVVFDFPEVTDANSVEADNIIECLEIDLKNYFGKGLDENDYMWYIDDAVGEKLHD